MLKSRRKVNSRRTKGPDVNDDHLPQQALDPLGLLDGSSRIATTREDKIEGKTPVTAYEILPFQEEIGTAHIVNEPRISIEPSDSMIMCQFFWSARLSLPRSNFGGS